MDNIQLYYIDNEINKIDNMRRQYLKQSRRLRKNVKNMLSGILCM